MPAKPRFAGVTRSDKIVFARVLGAVSRLLFMKRADPGARTLQVETMRSRMLEQDAKLTVPPALQRTVFQRWEPPGFQLCLYLGSLIW